jgi:prephenate dehydrogenase
MRPLLRKGAEERIVCSVSMLGRVTVVGCGLIGGSLVKSLRARASVRHLSAIDREDVVDAARPLLDAAATPGTPAALELLEESDLVVLATPVSVIVRDLTGTLDAIGRGAVVTDTGSVKAAVVRAAGAHEKRARFVPGHPMAGREVGGFESSMADLFEGVPWFVIDAASVGGTAAETSAFQPPDREAVERVTELARAVGAVPALIDPEAHDRAVAYVSHVPQLLASALYAVASRAGVVAQGGTGFRAVTRIAGGPSAIWRDIFEANRAAISAALGEILGPLEGVRAALAERGETGIAAALAILEEARIVRQQTSVAEPAAPESSP